MKNFWKKFWRSVVHDYRCVECDHPMHTGQDGTWACPIHDYKDPYEYLIDPKWRSHPEYKRLKHQSNIRKGKNV